MVGSKEESWTVGLHSPSWPLSALLLVLLSAAFTWIAFGSSPSISPPPYLPLGPFGEEFLLFFIPLVVGSAFSSPLAKAMGGKFNLKRSMLVGLLSALPIGTAIIVWRVYGLFLTPRPLEGVLMMAFGVVLWFNEMLIAGISGPTPLRSLPPSLLTPLLGVVASWTILGSGTWEVTEGILFLFVAFASGYFLLYATDIPLKREFGEGGVSIVRPLFDHMNDRDPEASKKLEDFFDRSSRDGELSASVLGFEKEGGEQTLWVVPTVHPGPFGELGASNLPHKLSVRLSSRRRKVIVPHAPCTHDQNVPTTGDVDKVAAQLGDAANLMEWSSASMASPLISPYPGSSVRAQALGEAVLLIVTLAPEATDDIDYSVGEVLREEARRLGFRDPIVVDAHNSFTGDDQAKGNVSFGSPASFRLIRDARAAVDAARKARGKGPVMVGFASKGRFTPQKDGLGEEGLAVTVIDAGGTTTAYALFDGNNLQQGIRERLLKVVEGLVDDCEVMTTDNHVVHEVEGGINPIGMLRKEEDLSNDLKETLLQALVNMGPARLASTSTMIRGVKVLGPGVTYRLMTALSDSFHIFWIMMPATFAITLSTELLILSVFH